MARSAQVISHWHLLVDGYNTSTLEYYNALSLELEQREIPAIAVERIYRREGGPASAKREYLRVIRDRLTFDICAAPYGKSFFFSWWLVAHPFRWATLLTIGLALSAPITFVIMQMMLFPLLICFGAFFALLLVTAASLFLRWFRPATYYAVDTQLMFQESVHRAVLAIIERSGAQHGMKALLPEERRPTMRDLLR